MNKIDYIISNFKEEESKFNELFKMNNEFSSKTNSMREIIKSDLSLKNKFLYLIPGRFMIWSGYSNRLGERDIQKGNFLKKRFLDNLEKRGKLDNIKKAFLNLFKKIEISVPNSDSLYDLMSNFLILKMVLVNDCYYVNNLIKKDDIVIDAGAHIGSFSIIASTRTGNKIFAFEPSNKTYACLKQNISNLKIKNINVINKGVGDSDGEKFFKVVPENYAGSTFSDSSPYNGSHNINEERVEVITLDSFVEKNKIPRVDFIKMDIEGYELRALKGAEKTIKKFKPKIAISAYHHEGDVQNIPKLILSLRKDYKYKLIDKGESDLIFW